MCEWDVVLGRRASVLGRRAFCSLTPHASSCSALGMSISRHDTPCHTCDTSGAARTGTLKAIWFCDCSRRLFCVRSCHSGVLYSCTRPTRSRLRHSGFTMVGDGSTVAVSGIALGRNKGSSSNHGMLSTPLARRRRLSSSRVRLASRNDTRPSQASQEVGSAKIPNRIVGSHSTD